MIIGDSNTYGWDPRDFFGEPYKKPWPKFLKEAGFEVLVDAMPGREIPHFAESINSKIAMIKKERPDILMIMLGSNDILNMYEPNVDVAFDRMKNFADNIKDSFESAANIILMAIPKIKIPGGYPLAGMQYNACLKQFALDLGFSFFKCDKELPLSYDGVHLTEEGHGMLGKAVVRYIKKVETESATYE